MTKQKKINFHPLLIDYHDRDDYGEIARTVALEVREGVLGTEEAILRFVADRFGSPTSRLSMRTKATPLAIFGEVGPHIPHNAVEQMNTVMRLPVTKRGALMPDAHHGYAMPIGGVAVLDNAVSPSFVGYDISCMMHLSLFDLDPQDFLRDRVHFARILQEETSFGLGASFAKPREHDVMDENNWSEVAWLKTLRDKAWSQLGSSGGGNHFADLMIVEFLQDMDGFRAGSQVVGLLTHSGSRGTGHTVATYYVKRAAKEIRSLARGVPSGYEWLPADSELGQEYLRAMELMGRYALANHQLIHYHFAAEAGLPPIYQIWNRHNYAWLDEASGEVIHRKGATPAEAGVLGVIPGTSGSASYLVEGLGNEESIFSSSHGAGRYHSRTEAKRLHDEDAFQRHMEQNDILHMGLAPDETIQAYKDIELVIGLQSGTLVRPLARMLPKVVIMGGQADDGD